MTIKYYPLFLKLAGKKCLVVGGGQVAARKIASLLEAGAQVRVVSPQVCEEIRLAAQEGRLELEMRGYRPGDLRGMRLVIAATDDPAVQEAVFSEAEVLGIPCNVVDKPEYCSFIVPSVVKSGDLTIAISTSGASPALARRLREELEGSFGPEWGRFLELMRRWRKEILSRGLPASEREAIFKKLAYSPIPQWLAEGREDKVAEFIAPLGLSLRE